MIIKKKNLILSVLCVLLSGLSFGQIVAPVQESNVEFQKRMQWFTDAQLGLFIHYGVYSTLGGEWKGKPVEKYAEWIQRYGQISPEEYIPLAANFNPDKLDADLWVKTAKETGMKYMVITTKHHEGFCLWDSAYTEFDIGEATKFKRDILGELKAACVKYGIKFGTYYSIIDWHHPSQRTALATNQPPMNDKKGYVTYMKAQLKELIDRYDPAIMWFDGDWVSWWTMEDGVDLYNYLREQSPNIIVNNRVAKRAEFKKDFGTPENSTPAGALDHIWEACWTVNHSWGFKKSDTIWKDVDVLIQKQIGINGKGGNLLLNVGPEADGTWPKSCIDRLQQVGQWNKTHSEAVYETAYVNVPEQTFGTISKTKASNDQEGELFVYVYDWPKDGKLTIKNLTFGKVKAFTYQGRGLSSQSTKTNTVIDVSKARPEPSATVLRLKYQKGFKVHEQAVNLGLKGDELILEARTADVKGRKLVLINKNYISGWADLVDRATWSLNVPAPGKYMVKALYANDKLGSDVYLTVGDQTLRGKVNATGKIDKFKLAELGVMNLNQVGAIDCTISFGDHRDDSLIHLKSLIFVPISE